MKRCAPLFFSFLLSLFSTFAKRKLKNEQKTSLLPIEKMSNDVDQIPPLRLAVLGAGTFSRAAWAPLLKYVVVDARIGSKSGEKTIKIEHLFAQSRTQFSIAPSSSLTSLRPQQEPHTHTQLLRRQG